LYLEVGNGGFGPGYGILGLRGGHGPGTGGTAIDLYREAHGTRSAQWSFLPVNLLPLCGCGCAIYSFADCSRPEGPMRAWDPNGGPTGREALFPQWFTLAEWLDRWVSGGVYQPLLVWDPAMWQWRSATDEEWAQQLAELDDPI